MKHGLHSDRNLVGFQSSCGWVGSAEILSNFYSKLSYLFVNEPVFLKDLSSIDINLVLGWYFHIKKIIVG